MIWKKPRVQIFDTNSRVTMRMPGVRPILCGVLYGCLALTVSGCVLGPDYVRPAIPALESQYQNASGSEGLDHPYQSTVGPHDEWWNQFGDPKLRVLVESAVANNQDLKAAYARVCESRSRFELSTIGPWPQLDATSVYSRRNQRNPGFLNGVNSNGGPGFDAFSNGLSASWEIDLFGRLRRGIESQDAQWGASLDELRDVLVTLISDVATNYVELRVLQKRRAIALENVDVQKRSLDIANQRYKAGLVGALDGKQAESVLWTTRALVPELDEQIQNRLNRICILLGESPHKGIQTWLGEGDIPALAAVIPGIPAELVSQRPDVRAAEKRMHSACAEIGVATADLYPRINLVGDLAYDSLDVSQLFSNQAFYSIGPSIRWNLITLGRTRRNINIREAQHDQSVAQFRQAVLQAVEEVENGLVGQRRRLERFVKLEKSTAAASDAYDLSLSTYEIGDSNFQRVLEAQRQLLNAQDSSTIARGNITLSIIQTYRALGAGWRTLEFTDQSVPEIDEGDNTVIQFIPRRSRGAGESVETPAAMADVTAQYQSQSTEFHSTDSGFLPPNDIVPESNPGLSVGGHTSDGLIFESPTKHIGTGDDQTQFEADSIAVPYDTANQLPDDMPSTNDNPNAESPFTMMPDSSPKTGFSPNVDPRIDTEWPAANGDTGPLDFESQPSHEMHNRPEMPTTEAPQSGNVFRSISYAKPLDSTKRVNSNTANRGDGPLTPHGFGFQKFAPPKPAALSRIEVKAAGQRPIRPTLPIQRSAVKNPLPQLFPLGTGHAGPSQ